MVCGAGCYVALVVAIMYFNCFFYNVMYILFCNVNKSHIDKSDIRADDASLIIMLFFLFFFSFYNGKIKGTNTLKTCICFGLCLCVCGVIL